MNEFWVVVSVVLGLFLRIGIPVIITLLIARGLRNLDKKWQEDAEKIKIEDLAPAERVFQFENCWEFFECSPSTIENCEKKGRIENPCWEVNAINGQVAAECLNCRFKELFENEIPSSVRVGIKS